ncbi:MAG: hypothetical protein WC333_01055 [Dehalococcoidia bacterium]|jgi:hypothetical protein
MNKPRVGIDINEVVRARWFQFDKFYIQEFGEEGAPKDRVYDLFSNYKWEDGVEITKELREPGEMPDGINPTDYQVNEKTGEAPADIFLFKKGEEKLTAKEKFNRFIYEDFVYEIHGSAPLIYKGLDLHLKEFCFKYRDSAEISILSVENVFSIPSTLFFLSKIASRFNNYCFLDKAIDMWKHADVLITSDPELIVLGAPWGKKLIKVVRPYNRELKKGSTDVANFNELLNNENFEKIIRYKNKKK